MHRIASLGFTILALILCAGPVCATPEPWSGNGHSYEAIYTPSGINWRAAYRTRVRRMAVTWRP